MRAPTRSCAIGRTLCGTCDLRSVTGAEGTICGLRGGARTSYSWERDGSATQHEEAMSHHFDTVQAKSDLRLNICDLYVFKGASDSTVFAMTCCPDAGISAPDTFHPEGIYAFRVDLNGDSLDELAFKFRFGEARHAPGDEHRHEQSFEVIRANAAELAGLDGALLTSGMKDSTAKADGVKAFAGMVPELWASDSVAFFNMLTNLVTRGEFDPTVFESRVNKYRNRNVMAMVLEIPNDLIGAGRINVWATVSLYGHAPEVQMQRWGLPLMTHLFLSDLTAPGMADQFNASGPSQDVSLFGPTIARVTGQLARAAGNTDAPEQYGQDVADRLCPAMLPYTLGTEARFDVLKFNGRPLTADVLDVMASIALNLDVADGVAPDAGRVVPVFPYFGAPYSAADQTGLPAIYGKGIHAST